MASPTGAGVEYYSNIKSKWATEYPSSDKLDDILKFYKECGYIDPQATLKSMVDPISICKNRILDYGCDKGQMLDFFCKSMAKKVGGYGIDINDEAIKVASQNHPEYHFKICNGLTIDYPDKYFDLVIIVATIKHVRYEDRATVYAELNRVADHALVIEADVKEHNIQSFMGWSFYNSYFAQEFQDNFDTSLKIVREAGDILGLYKCK